MEAKALNSGINDLRKLVLKQVKYHELEAHEALIKKEFRRLYAMDPTFTYMTKRSILIMVRINQKYGAIIPYHYFGNQIELEHV